MGNFKDNLRSHARYQKQHHTATTGVPLSNTINI